MLSSQVDSAEVAAAAAEGDGSGGGRGWCRVISENMQQQAGGEGGGEGERDGGVVWFKADESLEPGEPEWANYVKGVVKEFMAKVKTAIDRQRPEGPVRKEVGLGTGFGGFDRTLSYWRSTNAGQTFGLR